MQSLVSACEISHTVQRVVCLESFGAPATLSIVSGRPKFCTLHSRRRERERSPRAHTRIRFECERWEHSAPPLSLSWEFPAQPLCLVYHLIKASIHRPRPSARVNKFARSCIPWANLSRHTILEPLSTLEWKLRMADYVLYPVEPERVCIHNPRRRRYWLAPSKDLNVPKSGRWMVVLLERQVQFA